MRKSMKTASTLSAAAVIVLGLVLASPAGAAEGESPNNQEAPFTLVESYTTGLTIDCSTITDKGIQYAIDTQQNVCGVLSERNGGVAPYDSITFNCGEAHIYVYDQATTGGRAFITWGYNATAAPIWHGLAVAWDGQSNSGVFPDEAWFPPAAWEQSNVFFTGNGRASAELTGTVETVLWTCTVADPASSAVIY